MSDNLYRVLVVGPSGSGKSQFCNFVQKDLTNSINKVGFILDSNTIFPKSNKFKRIETNFDFIDTPGYSDCGIDDIEKSLKYLANYLKELKSIHHIILLLKFGERFTYDFKQYLKCLSKMFTANEFFRHLSFVFTKFPDSRSKMVLKEKNNHIVELNKLIKSTFGLSETDNLPTINIYYINTEINKDNEEFYQKNQDTIDIILEKILLNQKIYNPINTENLDITGKNAELRKEEELERLKKFTEKLKMEKTLREKEMMENKKRQEEILKIQKKIIEEQRRMKEILNEKHKERLKNYQTLNKISNTGREVAKVGGIGVLGSVGLGILGAIITPFCPIAGPVLIGAAIGGGTAGATEVAVGGTMAGVAEIKKQNL